MKMKVVVFFQVILCSSGDSTNALKEPAASIFRVEE